MLQFLPPPHSLSLPSLCCDAYKRFQVYMMHQWRGEAPCVGLQSCKYSTDLTRVWSQDSSSPELDLTLHESWSAMVYQTASGLQTVYADIGRPWKTQSMGRNKEQATLSLEEKQTPAKIASHTWRQRDFALNWLPHFTGIKHLHYAIEKNNKEKSSDTFTEKNLQPNFIQLLKNKITGGYYSGLTVLSRQKVCMLRSGLNLDRVTSLTYSWGDNRVEMPTALNT